MTEQTNKIITRFPPSPTGNLHIGNIRTFLFNYLFTRKQGGEIVMRFEDTDKERSKKEFENVALETLEKLGLDFDSGPFYQSKRTERYVEVLEKMIKDGAAFEGEESKDGSGDRVIRFKNPNKEITFTDVVRGDITIDTTDFGDFVIARSKTSPLYHLTVIVDDIDMGITHIIRGEDHITSTPRQILLIEALGEGIPTYAHLPLIIGADKKKLGKRHGAVTFAEFEALGYLPEAILNYLALLGWNPGDGEEQEIFSKEELIERFSLERINTSPAMFSYEKLDSINREYLLRMDIDEFGVKIFSMLPNTLRDFLNTSPETKNIVLHEIIKERINKFSDVNTMLSEGEFDWIILEQELDIEKLVWKKSTKEDTKKHLEKVLELFDALKEWNKDSIKNAIWDYASEVGRGDVLWPLRFGLTGRERSPDPFTVSAVLGKDEVTKRLKAMLQLL